MAVVTGLRRLYADPESRNDRCSCPTLGRRGVRVNVLVVVVLALILPVAQAGIIDDENAKPGTSEWKLATPALNGEIEGYASLTSAAPGETIRLYVRANDPDYTIEIFRMGWYGGEGGRGGAPGGWPAAGAKPPPPPPPPT